MKRFIVKKVKIVWRNSMLAGNPITRSFTKFGIYDRNWKDDRFCCCPRPGGEWATNNGQSRKYRLVVDDEQVAQKVADRLNELLELVPGTKCIDFKFPFISYCTAEKVQDISISKVEA